MADSQGVSDVVVSEFSWSPEFIQELLPSAERTALLYHLSYLCLGGFPKLERLIRKQAVDTQMLFGSSEAILLKCFGTSHNLVSSLFPILIKAVEMKKPVLAVKYLEKARTWITDITRAVDDIVNRYEQQNHNVQSCTSDVVEVRKETKKKVAEHTKEMKKLEEAVAKLEAELRKTAEEKYSVERKHQAKVSELQNSYVLQDSYVPQTNYVQQRQYVPRYRYARNIHGHKIKFHGSRFRYLYTYYSCYYRYYYTVNKTYAKTQSLKATATTHAVNAQLSHLASEKSSLINKEWKTQVKLTDLQLQLARSKIQQGEIPNPVHLQDVQKCLSRIQQILVDLKNFWEKVGAMVDILKDNTFVGEDLIDHLDDLKDEFVTFIKTAEMYWQKFGECCQRAQCIFSVQSKDAYKFLETDPSLLSEEEQNKQYQSIMGRLQQISPALTES